LIKVLAAPLGWVRKLSFSMPQRISKIRFGDKSAGNPLVDACK